MPLKPCRECGAEVPADAPQCPACTVPGPTDYARGGRMVEQAEAAGATGRFTPAPAAAALAGTGSDDRLAPTGGRTLVPRAGRPSAGVLVGGVLVLLAVLLAFGIGLALNRSSSDDAVEVELSQEEARAAEREATEEARRAMEDAHREIEDAQREIQDEVRRAQEEAQQAAREAQEEAREAAEEARAAAERARD